MFWTVLFWLCLWHLGGVFGNVEKSVSVKKGDSVTLDTDLTQMRNDEIQWWFWIGNTLIAQINKRTDSMTVYDDVLDGRFRDRLKLDSQTGSLTITNTRPEHAGNYEVEINHITTVFVLMVYEEISVMKEDTVTLSSDLTEVMDDDQIWWWFGSENILMAEMIIINNRFTVYDDVLDGRFRDRLKLDKQTGSLTITNISTQQVGRYKLLITGAKKSLKTFRVSVYGFGDSLNKSTFTTVSVYNSVHCCSSTEAVIRLVLSALVGVATVVLLVYDIRSRRARQDQAHIHTPENTEKSNADAEL